MHLLLLVKKLDILSALALCDYLEEDMEQIMYHASEPDYQKVIDDIKSGKIDSVGHLRLRLRLRMFIILSQQG